ncbi:hypothetical protein JW921_09410 [Candidatus Fermentibacterales bacterium]|nr:hypothetical protein [Candidatus Fermentibacterales bacterium]
MGPPSTGFCLSLAFPLLCLSRAVALPDAHGSDSDIVTIENGQVLARITPCLDQVRAGSLVELTDLATGIDLVDYHQFCGLQCGPMITDDGMIVVASSREAAFYSPRLIDISTGETLPIETCITYRLVGRGIEIRTGIHTSGEAELWYPLEMDFHVGAFDTLQFSNQTTPDRTVVPQEGLGLYRISGDQVVRAVRCDSLLEGLFLFPNPAKAILALNAETPDVDHYLSIRMFDVEPPRENCTGPLLHSVLPPDSTYSFYAMLSLDPGFCPAYFCMHPGGYERTASWMLDEIPFIHPEQGDIWGFSEDPYGDEPVSAGLISLLIDHPDMLMNWLILPDAIFDANADSMWFEPGYEESWSHWHCTWRVSTEATPEFLQWLLNIQEGFYPWSERVRLGCHGYHHTPNEDSTSGSMHEFITYEPEEHVERFAMIEMDFLDMGLCQDSICAIRYAGHRTSLSGLWATIGSGMFDFYCNGVRWYEYMGGEPFYDLYLSRYETAAGRIWGTNTVWWGDYQMMYPYEYLSTVMLRGKHALLGCHPICMLAGGTSPEAYERADSVCGSLEQDYPWFGWVFPSDYGRFLEETYMIMVDSVRTLSSSVELHFSGGTGTGQHAVVEIPEGASVQEVTIDGSPAGWELHSPTRLFVDCGVLPRAAHVLRVGLSPEGVEARVDRRTEQPVLSALSCPAQSSGEIGLRGAGFRAWVPVRVLLFDACGRLLCSRDAMPDGSGGFEAGLVSPSGGLPAGIYIALAVQDGLHGAPSLRLVLLPGR